MPVPRVVDIDDPLASSAATTVAMPPEPERPREFGAFYRSTVAPLRRYLARLLGNGTEAEDVAQDAYVRIYPSVTKDAAERPEALLYVTARRLAINRLKRRSISPLGADPVAVEMATSAAPGVPQQVMARQELQMLEHAIAELPEGCRTVLLLRKVELLSHKEISDRLGIAISTVEKQHARALRLLKAAMALKSDTGTTVPPGAAESTEASS